MCWATWQEWQQTVGCCITGLPDSQHLDNLKSVKSSIHSTSSNWFLTTSILLLRLCFVHGYHRLHGFCGMCCIITVEKNDWFWMWQRFYFLLLINIIFNLEISIFRPWCAVKKIQPAYCVFPLSCSLYACSCFTWLVDWSPCSTLLQTPSALRHDQLEFLSLWKLCFFYRFLSCCRCSGAEIMGHTPLVAIYFRSGWKLIFFLE